MLGRILSHYEILKELGKGGMGEVYLAQDTKLNRYVAIKILPSDLVADKDRMKRFLREARAASAISHSNVAHIYEIGETDGTHFIAMEYIEGETLASRMRRTEFTTPEILEISAQITDALREAHSKGIIHRDIKPANVMLTSRGNVKLLDFGLAKILLSEATDAASSLPTATRTELGTAMGTLPYMSPEQLRGQYVDHRTDIFSLGVLLYQLSTKQLPFEGTSAVDIADAILHKNSPPPRRLNPRIPSDLSSLICKMLEKNPNARYQNAEEILAELRKLQQPTSDAVPVFRLLRKKSLLIPTIVLALILVSVGLWLYYRFSNIRWAREEALPQILQLVDQDKSQEAFALATRAERFIPDDRILKAQWPNISRTISIQTTPAGAKVFIKDYRDINAEWQYIGETPLQKVRFARGFFRWKVSKSGYGTAFRVAPENWYEDQIQLSITLDPESKVRRGMVRIDGGRLTGSRFEWLKPIDLDGVWMDQYEVSNQEFKKFVDAGGYRSSQYWKIPFIKDGRELSREKAMNDFRDTTGRPGPAGWELGDYPKGEEHNPVTGVSWYEAAAYAEFAGKSLPTIYHWFLAAGIPLSFEIVPLSNFQGQGIRPIGTGRSMSPFGTFDMAGNVKEWCWNETVTKERYLLGGAYNDQQYLFYQPDKRSPFQREKTFGFRCVSYFTNPPAAALFLQPVEVRLRDYDKERPVSDEVYRIISSLYDYKKTNLAARIESTEENEQLWRKETVTFNAAYGDERMIAHLFFPKGGLKPYQAVIFFPGFWARDMLSSENVEDQIDFDFLDFVIRSGRVGVYPVYKGTFERGGGPAMQELNPNQLREWTFQHIKDVRRTVDYLETRGDIDRQKIAFYGYSWGARVGAIIGAVEDRIQVMILAHGGFHSYEKVPEIDEFNFAPHVKMPVLMINGRYDHIFPVESSQKPFFKSMGTAPEHKRHLVFDGGHITPRNELIKAVLDWLDHYLGPTAS